MDLISIHIPKTGGTSFYNILQQVYGEAVSKSYKRKDYHAAIGQYGTFESALPSAVSVLHGHMYYSELKSIHKKYNSKVICWLRDPVDRVISNYLFFINGLKNPSRNPVNYKANKHRINETLLEYASRPENQNRISDFLDGIPLEDLFFIGHLENFTNDIDRLAALLEWENYSVPVLNKGTKSKESNENYEQIKKMNQSDIDLYQKALQIQSN